MQLNPTNQLDVVRHHVPYERVAGHHDSGALKAPARLAHGRKGLRKQLVEHFSNAGPQLPFHAATTVGALQFEVDALALRRVGGVVLGRLELRHAALDRTGALGKDCAELRSLPLDLFIGQRGQARFDLMDLGQHRLHPLPFTFVTRAEHASNQSLQHTNLMARASPPRSSRTPSGARWVLRSRQLPGILEIESGGRYVRRHGVRNAAPNGAPVPYPCPDFG